MEGASFLRKEPLLKSSSHPSSRSFIDRLNASGASSLLSTTPAFGQVPELGSTIQSCSQQHHTILPVVCTYSNVAVGSSSSPDEQALPLMDARIVVVPTLISRSEPGSGSTGGINFRSYWNCNWNLDTPAAGCVSAKTVSRGSGEQQYNEEDIPTEQEHVDKFFQRRKYGTFRGDPKRQKKKTTSGWLIALLFTLLAFWFGMHLLNNMGYFRSIPFLCGIVSLWSTGCLADADQSPALRDSLLPFALNPVPLGTIRPRGWLSDQLDLMANGLAGNQHKFYRFVANSPWIGGDSEYSQLHEGFPYWLNGIVPLAYSVENPVLAKELKDAVEENVNKVLERQASDGWLGPETIDSKMRNLWGRMPLLLAFTQLLDADPQRYSKTMLPALRKYLDLTHSMLQKNGTGYLGSPSDALSDEDHGWGRVRAADMMITLQWLIEHDQEGGQKQKHLETMDMLRSGMLDWADWYNNHYISKDFSEVPEATLKTYFPWTHGVNVGQGLKAGAVINRFERNATMVDVSRKAVELTFKHHGAPSGSILADERLQGLSPYSGSELCTTVETIYSLAYLYQSLGDNSFADRAERAAFNALPAAVMGDWWAHQYITQPNQPSSTRMDKRPFWNVNQKGQTFGLEPDYPCCTVNHPQGYPKFLSHSWATNGEDGIAHALLSPSALNITLANGANVQVEATTDYPFWDLIHYATYSDKPFTLHVRIPGWTNKALTTISINGVESANLATPDTHTGLLAIPLPAGTSSLAVALSRSITTEKRQNDAVAVFHGPLLYTLDVGYSAKHTHPPRNFGDSGASQEHVPEKCMDWDIHNTTKWNMAVDVASLRPIRTRAPDAALPLEVWSRDGPPTALEGTGCEVDWPLLYPEVEPGHGIPGRVPQNARCASGVKKIRYVPFGSAKVGMAELPVMQRGVIKLNSGGKTNSLEGGFGWGSEDNEFPISRLESEDMEENE